MRRLIQAMVIAVTMMLAGLWAWPAWAQTTPCQLAPVFVMLRDQIGRERTGECTGPQIRNEAGDFTQPTTRGILTLRTADQVVAFSDGQTTWLYGPNGLESRPSGSRLPWEGTGAARTGTGSGPSSPMGSGASAATPTPTPPFVPPTPTPTFIIPTPTPTAFTMPATPTPFAAQPAATSADIPPPVISLPPGYATSPTIATSPSSSTFAPGPDSAVSLMPTAAASPMTIVQDDLPLTIDGNNAVTSRPIGLTGGDYAVHWEVSLPRGTTSCYMGSRLRRVDDQNPGALVMHTTLNSTKDRSSVGDSRLFAVAPGRYVVDVTTTGCTWKFILAAP